MHCISCTNLSGSLTFALPVEIIAIDMRTWKESWVQILDYFIFICKHTVRKHISKLVVILRAITRKVVFAGISEYLRLSGTALCRLSWRCVMINESYVIMHGIGNPTFNTCVMVTRPTMALCSHMFIEGHGPT